MGAPEFIADTSVIIRLARRDSLVEANVRDKNFAITFVTVAELDVGILKASAPADAAKRLFAEVLAGVQVFGGSGRTPAHYARIYHDLERQGKMIPKNDIWIASIAIEVGLPILACDEHFSRVRGLTVIQC